MIILIEGLNCCGKTTLARQFSEHLELPIVKFNVPGPDPHTEFTTRLRTAWEEHHHFIVERLHLSNSAYDGRLGGGVLSPNQWNQLDQALADHGCVLYWMVDTPHAIEARLKERSGRQDGAETMGRGQIGEIMHRFDRAYTQSQIPNKGSFRLPQFCHEGQLTEQFNDHVLLLKGLMARVHYWNSI